MRACSPCRPSRPRTSPMRMRSMSAPRSPTARATTAKRRGCWSPASRCAAASATRSTSRQRCPPRRAPSRGDAARARARRRRSPSFASWGIDREAIVLLQLGEICVHAGDDERRAGISSNRWPSRATSSTRRRRATASGCSGSSRWNTATCPPRAPASSARWRSVGAGTNAARPSALWWLGKADLAGGDAVRAPAARRSVALVPIVRDECRSARLSRGPRAPRACPRPPEEAARLYAVAAAIRERLVLPRAPRGDQRWRDDVAAATHSARRRGFRRCVGGRPGMGTQGRDSPDPRAGLPSNVRGLNVTGNVFDRPKQVRPA